jgi:hypothetical protein
MKIFLFCCLLAVSFSLRAQSYNVALVPDSLKKDARAIIREDEYILEIKSPGKAITKSHTVYTIFDENGENIGGYTGWYDKFISINSVTGILYDASGKEMKKVRKKDMDDRSYVSEGTLAEDFRYKEYNFYCRVSSVPLN